MTPGTLGKPSYAARWKLSIWRIQLVSGFQLVKIWSTNFRFNSVNNLQAGEGRSHSNDRTGAPLPLPT
jgi:hypothetical protein